MNAKQKRAQIRRMTALFKDMLKDAGHAELAEAIVDAAKENRQLEDRVDKLFAENMRLEEEVSELKAQIRKLTKIGECGYADCDKHGTVDSGGSYPWGEAIRVACPECNPEMRIRVKNNDQQVVRTQGIN